MNDAFINIDRIDAAKFSQLQDDNIKIRQNNRKNSNMKKSEIR
jgi:hypothetical protein